MFRTGTGKEIKFEEIGTRMNEFFNRTKHYESEYEIVIGTDSQNHSQTKVVSVVCIVCSGHGGIFSMK